VVGGVLGSDSGVYRAFDHEAPIAIVFYVRGRVRCAQAAVGGEDCALSVGLRLAFICGLWL
jgi:hypothetical protein